MVLPGLSMIFSAAGLFGSADLSSVAGSFGPPGLFSGPLFCGLGEEVDELAGDAEHKGPHST